jgi:hypothetical protein
MKKDVQKIETPNKQLGDLPPSEQDKAIKQAIGQRLKQN